MTRETKTLIVSRSISGIVVLAILYSFIKFTMWLWPELKWINITLSGILAIDFALILSGIAPKGFETLLERRKK